MRVLVVGGSGYVGSLVLPYLAERHELRVFDLRPPRTDLDLDYVPGDIRDFAAVSAAICGMPSGPPGTPGGKGAPPSDPVDAVLFMAMGPMADWGSPDNARAHFDVAVTGLYLCLRAAREHGVKHAVYTSSMSVYQEPVDPEDYGEPYPDETAPPDNQTFYGLAKRLGEEVCRNAVRLSDMSIVAIRLCHPTADAEFPSTKSRRSATVSTSARDTARAILAALDYWATGSTCSASAGTRPDA